MNSELTIRQNVSMMPVMDISLAIERQRQLISFVKEIMVEGVDYGKVPGTEKDTLLKPGAEKLSTFFGLAPQFEDAGSVDKWDAVEPLFFYRYKCKLYKNDALIGEGIGSCNSRESKYRWRWVEEKDLPPHLDTSGLLSRSAVISEFEFAINKRETTGKYGKPLTYWQAFEAAIKSGEARQINKKTAGNKEYPAWEIETRVYRVPNEDIFSQVNTIDKMAQKRALVAAVLIGVNASEFFTQDMEDLADNFTFVESTANPVIKTETPAAESPKPAAKPEPTKSELDEAFPRPAVPTNGSPLINSPQLAIAEAHRQLGQNYYNTTNGKPNVSHATNALKQELGSNWNWPFPGNASKPADAKGWNEAIGFLVYHAKNQLGMADQAKAVTIENTEEIAF